MNVCVIAACWGEYDDYTTLNISACNTEDEAWLIIDALNNREDPYWGILESYFKNEYSYVPNDISFKFDKIPLLSI